MHTVIIIQNLANSFIPEINQELIQINQLTAIDLFSLMIDSGME